jgi:hypothetical protein
LRTARVTQLLTLIRECPKYVGLDQLHHLLEYVLIEQVLRRVHAVLEGVNEIDHSLLLLLLKFEIFLWVTEVGRSVASPQLCHIQGLPLVQIHV